MLPPDLKPRYEDNHSVRQAYLLAYEQIRSNEEQEIRESQNKFLAQAMGAKAIRG